MAVILGAATSPGLSSSRRAPVTSERMFCAQDDGMLFRTLVNSHRTPGLVGGITDVLQRTVHAFRTAGNAQFASVPDDLVGEQSPLFPWNDLHQILLDPFWIVVARKFQAAADAVDVGIDNHPFVLAKPRTQD